jgi:carboxypeptidase PM20D1
VQSNTKNLHAMKTKKNFSLTLLAYALLCFTLYAQPIEYTELPESARLLSQYIQVPSVSGTEKEAGEFLAGVCKAKGLNVELFPQTTGGFNFAASLYPLSENKPNIIFLNHIDVVPAGADSSWTYPPFSGAIHNGMVWGRGVIDMKGMTIMQLLALEGIKQSYRDELPYNITLLCVSREEVDNGGAKAVIAEHFEQLNAIVVFGEGGAGINGLSSANPDQVFFTVSVAEKKALWLKLILEVPSSGHGSVPPLEYTNQVMVKALNRLLDRKIKLEFDETTTGMFKTLGQHERGIKRTVLKHPRFFTFLLKSSVKQEPILLATLTNTVTVTNIANPPLAANQIAQKIEVTLDCRLLPGTDTKGFTDDLKKAMKSARVNFTIAQETPSATPSRPGIFYQKFKNAIETVHAGGVVIPTLFPAYSDNTFFRNMGVPVYGINPVFLSLEQLSSVHNFNEHIAIEELEKGRQVYSLFLNNLIDLQKITAKK